MPAPSRTLQSDMGCLSPTLDSVQRPVQCRQRTNRAREGAVRRQTFIKPDKASELLAQLVSAKNPLPNPPPGDTRWSARDPRFRRHSMIEAAAVNDAGRPSPERLAALLALVYQVRCS